MKINLQIIITLICVIISISSQSKSTISNNLTYDIPDTIYNFFPNDNEGVKLVLITSNAEKTDIPFYPENFSTTYLVKIFKYDDMEKKTFLVNSLQRKMKFSVLSENNNYFIISSQSELYNLYDSISIKIRYSEFQHSYLILNFRDLFKNNLDFIDTTTICGLPKGYEIDVLNAGNKYILPEKYKYDWRDLPIDIIHGYRSGIAYNKLDLYIIYWVVAW